LIKKYKYYIIIALVVLVLLLFKNKAKANTMEKNINNIKYRILSQSVIRVDNAGNGNYQSSRIGHVHQGIDLICTPGENILAPFAGKVLRQANPYANDASYKGLEYVSTDGTLKMKLFYVNNFSIGQTFKTGEVFAKAQNIALKYGGGMLPHVHVELRINGFVINPTSYFI
jgi:murein DD-endopeptidase MepM/ murein hydrolase activator NlpD